MDAAIGQRHSELALGEKAVEGPAGRHPLLGNWDFDREAVATASRPDVQRQLLRYIRERRHDIAHTRRNLAANPNLVFRLTPFLEATSAFGRVEPGSVLERIVRERAAQARWNDAMTDLVIGTLALAVGFLTAGGGAVLMLGGMALTAGLGGWQTARELHRYEVIEAAAGAQLAAPEDRESLAWAVLALGATGLDAVGLGLALDGLRPALVAFNGSGDLLALKEAIAPVPLPPQARASVLEAGRLRAREAAAWRPARRAGVLAYDVLAVIAERFGSFAYAVLTSVRARSREFAAFLDSAEALKKTGRHTLKPDALARRRWRSTARWRTVTG